LLSLGLNESSIDTIAELYFVLKDNLNAHRGCEDSIIICAVSDLHKHWQTGTSGECA